jgi:pyruvate/2-oxoglutarate dehydrogenase complex dihydrolipoamide dehydrogenase (E3) component
VSTRADIPHAHDSADDDATWRRLVFPHGYRNPPPAHRYNLVVIGAGPAGLVTSIVAAGLGAKVALVERHAMGGDCLNVGCVPSKTLLAATSQRASFSEALGRVRAVRAQIAQHDSVERYVNAGVDVFLGSASFISPHEIRVADAVLRTRKTVIATGSRAAMPSIPGLSDLAPLTHETIFDLQERPARLAILGGGPVGCELAQAFARLGTQVHLIEQQARVLSSEEPEASELIAQALARDGVRLHLEVRVTAASSTGCMKTLALENGLCIEADQILIAAGRVRNIENLGLEHAGVRCDVRSGIEVDKRLRTSHRDIFAAGDVCSRFQLTHAADAHARIVVRNALFLGRARADRLLIPSCTYTRPEVAHVGASTQELTKAGREYDRYRFEFGDLDRGRTDGAADGYAEVLTVRGDDTILGATIVGKDAGEQIAPVILMMTQRIGLGDLASLVLPYPTRSEYLRRIADAFTRKRLTPLAAGSLRWWLARTR